MPFTITKKQRTKLLDLSLFSIALVLVFPSIQWVKKAFLGLYDPFNLVLLFFIAGLIIHKLSEKNRRLPTVSYSFHLIPFLLSIISLFLWIYFSYFLKIHIFSATFGFTLLFGLVGLYIAPQTWTKSIVPVGLLLMTMPFGNAIDVYIGFPLRIWTVGILESFFHNLGWNSVTSSTIITIDNTASQIDFSCSGLKGLWAGLIFYFAISWLENLKIGWKWLTGLALLFFLLLAANIIRIFSIITLTAHYELGKIAQLIHAPLGIIGFTFSCGIVLFFIKSPYFRKGKMNRSIHNILFSKDKKGFVWTKYLLGILLISAFFIPKPHPSAFAKKITIPYPSDWHVSPLKLTTKEAQFFSNQGSSAQKISFSTDKISGSMLLLKSPDWKGHHNPEYCIRAGGHQINLVETIQIADSFPIKWLQVNQEATACYWFQNPRQITDDFSTRVWSELRHSQNEWMLISIVFNNNHPPSDTATTLFIKQLKQLISQQLNQDS